MKNILSLLFPVFIFLSVKALAQQSIDSNDLVLEVSKKDWRVENGKFIVVLAATIKNISTDTLNFVNQNGCYDEYFMTDNPDIQVYHRGCDKNFPEKYILAPNKSYHYNIEIYVSKERKPNPNVRLGFDWYVTAGTTFFDPHFNMQLRKLLWSVPLNLNQL